MCLLLAGCGLGGGLSYGEHQPYRPENGSRLSLNSPLSVPAGNTRVWLAEGRVLPYGRFTFAPSCTITLRERSQQPRAIEPRELVVTGSSFERDTFVVLQAPIRVASMAGFDISNGGPPSHVTNAIRIRFSDPEIKELICGRLGDWSPPSYLTRAELVETLGAVIGLELQ
jgi:hypothetical protein